jgi:anti-sigma factor RsiW
MRCKDVIEDISAWVDGELGPKEREAVEAHLETCADCSRSLAEYRALGKLLGLDADVEAGPEFLAAVHARVREQRASSPLKSALIKGAAAVAATVLLVLGLLFFQERGVPDPSVVPGPDSVRPAFSAEFSEVERAVKEDPEILEILNHLDALEEIELLENLDLLERMDEFRVDEADDLAEAAENVLFDSELPVALGE